MSEWQTIFNGHDLSGWKATGNAAGWSVADGCILCKADGGGYLYTEACYEDFDLRLEYRTEPNCNSGVFFRWSDLKDPVHTGLEIQILDTHGEHTLNKQSSGALYDLVAPTQDVARPAGEWNQLVLSCVGPLMRLEQNGLPVWEVDVETYDTAGRSPDGELNKFRHAWKDLPRQGHLGLQDHGGVCWFRDLSVRVS